MFDISWSEFLLIGIVALIVIGPKELPTVMRTVGQWTRKIRSMAGEFQSQFHEAMREAEMSDLKQQVDDIASDVRQFDPLKSVREDVETVGQDVQRSLTDEHDAALPAATEIVSAEAATTEETLAPAQASVPAAIADPAAGSAVTEAAATEPMPQPQSVSGTAEPEMETAGALPGTETGAADAAAEKLTEPDRTERTG
jgi:sec-independent protein translocase protein TatB